MPAKTTRSSSRQLTRKDRTRRPVLYAAAVLGIGGGGALVAAPLGGTAPLGVAVVLCLAFLAAVVGRDLGILRAQASEQAALAALAPLRGDEPYPVNPATLPPENMLFLIQRITLRQPRCIVEFGSGTSSRFMGRALAQMGSDTRVYSLEHEEKWFAVTRQSIREAGLEERVTVLHAPLVPTEGIQVPWYDLAALPDDLPPIDLLLVDGPEGGSRDPLARVGGFLSVRDRLAADALVLLDDGCRTGERAIAEIWRRAEPSLAISFHKSHNGMWVFERRV